MEQWELQTLQTVKQSFQSRFTGSIEQWASQNVDLQSGFAIKGKYNPSISPHFRKIFASIQDATVREVSILAPQRSFKTGCCELSLMYFIAHSSGDVLWLNLTDEKADQVSDVRMMPMVNSCPPVKELLDENKKYNLNKKRYSFKHTTVHITSPKDNTFNSLGYKYVFFDECKDADKGVIKEAKARTDDYQGVSKCIFFSKGGTVESGWHEQWYSGEQWVYGYRCPHCHALQPLEFQRKRDDGSFAGVRWEPTAKDAYGRWDIPKCANNCWLECYHCRGRIEDTPQTRYNLLLHGDWVKTGDGIRSKTVKSFRFTNLCNQQMKFSELVTRFLEANAKIDNHDLSEFIVNDCASFWDSTPNRDRIRIKETEYDPGNPFGEFENKSGDTPFRFMAVDSQRKEPFFYYGIVSVATNGNLRVIKYGKCNTFDELEALQRTYKVEYRYVGMDTADGENTERLKSEMILRGRDYHFAEEDVWGCYMSLRGADVMSWKHDDGMEYPYKEPEEHYVAGNEDKFLTHIVFSKTRYSQILESLRDGKGQITLEFAEVTDELTTHLNSNSYQLKPNGKWGYVSKPNAPDHFFDVFKMLLVMVDFYGLLNSKK